MIETGNLIEGFLWIAIGLCFAVSLVRPAQRKAKLVAAINFVVFGFSDFVEMRTGAWWRPPWLPAWKAACVLVMLTQLVRYLKARGRVASAASPQEGGQEGGSQKAAPRSFLRRGVFPIVRIAALAYVGLAAVLLFFQSWLVYRPSREIEQTPGDLRLPYEEVRLTAADGTELSAWYIPAQGARGAVLVCHGNGGNISHRLPTIRTYHQLGYSVLIFDYRGYGQSSGRPSEAGTYQDAAAAWEHLVRVRKIPPERIVVFGRSLGGAVATHLARARRPGALILESTFTSVPDLAAKLYPFLPVRYLCRFSYNVLAMVREIRCPILIAHGPDDDMVPYSHGRALFEAAAEPKQFLEMVGGHNDGLQETGPRYADEVKAFLDHHVAGRGDENR